MKVNIRRATPDDLAFLLELEAASFPPFQQNSKQSLKRAITSPFQEVFITEFGDRNRVKIGAGVLFKYKHSLRIYSIGLLPKYQRLGFGDEMIHYIKDFARKNQFGRIVLEVSARATQLIDWYREKGFQAGEEISDYYCPGEHALKMQFELEDAPRSKRTFNLIVINQPFRWDDASINARIISVKEYINNPLYQNSSDFRIFNLCSSYRYQSYGYYVSLLASARGQRVIPSIATIRDFRILNVIQSAAFEVDDLINRSLESSQESHYSLNIYFGQTPVKEHQTLALKLYQLFETPLFRVNFIKHERWLIKEVKVLNLKNIPEEDKEIMHAFASDYFNRKRYNFPKLTNFKYDLAILVNPREDNPPSNPKALQHIKKTANKKGLYVEFITKTDADKINEFDALFIRETTNVNHHTYEMSRLAYAEGLVVIDDPWSILRCSNKIYQSELFKKNKISTPNTVVLTKNLFDDKLLDELPYPMVLKQPDSAFSMGVIKVDSKEEAQHELRLLFKKSDMVISQEFLYSEFDWRIGILDNKPLFACKYFMSKDHWQIYDWKSNKKDKSGSFETLRLEEVPADILETAQKAASLIGDGLYGVDVKRVNGQVYVVEVNDNPNLDYGVEDKILKDELYATLIDSIINRIEIARNIRKINFTEH
jgi:glutathione synthase/RimK-type ligase-like ATP-grasp enzyme/ribosomal protein S18 acetylase RimI-like enzyme